jgi:hypothetical protein
MPPANKTMSNPEPRQTGAPEASTTARRWVLPIECWRAVREYAAGCGMHGEDDWRHLLPAVISAGLASMRGEDHRRSLDDVLQAQIRHLEQLTRTADHFVNVMEEGAQALTSSTRHIIQAADNLDRQAIENQNSDRSIAQSIALDFEQRTLSSLSEISSNLDRNLAAIVEMIDRSKDQSQGLEPSFVVEVMATVGEKLTEISGAISTLKEQENTSSIAGAMARAIERMDSVLKEIQRMSEANLVGLKG